jgi:hypothetical protein
VAADERAPPRHHRHPHQVVWLNLAMMASQCRLPSRRSRKYSWSCRRLIAMLWWVCSTCKLWGLSSDGDMSTQHPPQCNILINNNHPILKVKPLLIWLQPAREFISATNTNTIIVGRDLGTREKKEFTMM